MNDGHTFVAKGFEVVEELGMVPVRASHVDAKGLNRRPWHLGGEPVELHRARCPATGASEDVGHRDFGFQAVGVEHANGLAEHRFERLDGYRVRTQPLDKLLGCLLGRICITRGALGGAFGRLALAVELPVVVPANRGGSEQGRDEQSGNRP